MTARPAAAALGLAVAACTASGTAPPSVPWSNGPALPTPRLAPGVTALGVQLIVLDGIDATLAPTTEVDVLDTAVPVGMQQWMPLPAAPRAWTNPQLAAIGTTLYLLGGLDGSGDPQPDAFALDTGAPPASWQPLASLPPALARGGAAVITAPPRVYLLGGAGGDGALASNLYYNTTANAWCPGAACSPDQQLPDLPAPRALAAAMQMTDGTLVVVGGFATLDATQPAADVWWLPVNQQNTAGHWQTKTPMPTARGDCAYGQTGGRLVCAGGEAGPNVSTTVQAYEPSLDSSLPAEAWTMLPDMPGPRTGTPGAAVGLQLFVPGGEADVEGPPLATLLVLDVADTVQ